jgi:DNA replication protein DnaC
LPDDVRAVLATAEFTAERTAARVRLAALILIGVLPAALGSLSGIYRGEIALIFGLNAGVSVAAVALLLTELRLPAVKLVWADLAAQADKEGWSAARFLAAVAEHEMAERGRRRIERHLAASDAWLDKGVNVILFGPPGGGKSHLAAALGFALVENGWRVLFTRTTDLVQRLQIARRELALESAIARLDKYHLLILDDLAYVTKDQAETSVLFELIGARYERRSLLVTANQPFGEWEKSSPTRQ